MSRRASKRIATGVSLALALAGASPLHAQTPQECAAIEEDGERLACYDRIFRAPAPEQIGAWEVKIEGNPREAGSISLLVRSQQPHVNRWGESQPLTLTIACSNGSTSIGIYFAGDFMSSLRGGAEISYRLDEGATKRRTLVPTRDNSQLGLWVSGFAVPFVKELLEGSRLVVRATPFGRDPLSAEFPIAGLTDAIQPLREACGW